MVIFFLFCFLFLLISLFCLSIYPLYLISIEALLRRFSSFSLRSISLFSSTSGLESIDARLLFSSRLIVSFFFFKNVFVVFFSKTFTTNVFYCSYFLKQTVCLCSVF